MKIEGTVLVEVTNEDINENGELIIPEGITEIGRRAVFQAVNLEKVIIPNSVTKIGEEAFTYCFALETLNIPNSVETIEESAFRECRCLESVSIPSGIKSIGEKVFSHCVQLSNVSIPEGITSIPKDMFSYCRKLEEVQLPKSVKTIGKSAFEKCASMKKFELPNELEVVGKSAFSGCRALEKIELPESVKQIGESAFSECVKIKEINLPSRIEAIEDSTFANCYELAKVQIPEQLKKIGFNAFCGCSKLEEIEIPEGVTEISDDAFCRCSILSKVTLPQNLKTIGRRAFNSCKQLAKIDIPNSVTTIGDSAFRRCFKLKKINIPSNIEKIGNYAFLFNEEELNEDEINKELTIPETIKFLGTDFFNYNNIEYDKKNKLIKLYNSILPHNYIPSEYLGYLCKEGKLVEFLKHANFNNYESHLFEYISDLNFESDEDQFNFFKFAVNLGCFSNKKIIDKNGKETGITYSQKASAVLALLLKSREIEISDFSELFDENLPTEMEPNLDFINFLTPQGKEFTNLKLLLDMEKEYPGIFAMVMKDFDIVKNGRKTIAENGTPEVISWEEAIKRHFLHAKYKGTTPENEDMAELFGSKGLNQEVFDLGVQLREQAKKNNVPAHILGKELKELSYLEQIRLLKDKTQKELENSKLVIDRLYKHLFTYEWLSKKSAKNAIMGLYTDCCATIVSSFYGEKGSRHSITSKDLQHLIIRNIEGKIVAKGLVYVNQEQGYAVINDFELNEKYKKHEIKDDTVGGRYPGDYKQEKDLTDAERQDRENRDLIFAAFQRGIEAFAKEYDIQHPDRPLMQVNVGMGYNKLKRNVEQFEKASKALSVPIDYAFEDAQAVQYVLYRRNGMAEEEMDR